jgi:Glycosyl hydrolase family 26
VKLIATGIAVLALSLSVIAVATASSNIEPSKGALFGAFPNGGGGVSALEHSIGRKLAIDNRYVPWTFSHWSTFSTDVKAGRIPMISWSAARTTTAAAIASGKQDATLRRAALALKAVGGKILLRPFYEFDQPKGHPRYIGTPSQVIAAWRHTFNVFRAAGNTNVRFVWCPMSFDFSRGVAQKYWPGAQYVQWVGADGYNFPNQKWRTFGQIFDSAYSFATSVHKPMMAAETASPANDPRTPAWMAGAAQWIEAHPDFKAVDYFDSVSPKGFNFRVTSNASVLSAFRAWGKRSYFSPM